MRQCFYLLLLCLYCINSYAQTKDKDDPLWQFMHTTQTMQGHFTHRLFNPQGNVIEQSSGTLSLSLPSKFRWDYTEPYEQSIISNGQVLWIYDIDIDQLIIKDIATVADNTPLVIFSSYAEVEKHFFVENIGVIEGANWVELSAKDKSSQYHRIRMGFDDDDKPLMMLIFDEFQQVTRIDFMTVNSNIHLEDEIFYIDPPAKVDVIDERTLSQ